MSSSLAVSPGGDAVAYTAAAGRDVGRGTETVYVLRAGTRAAVAVHREHVVYAPCERGAAVAWHGRWVLYTATEGNVAVIDTARGERAVELRAFIKALPGMRGGWSAFWG